MRAVKIAVFTVLFVFLASICVSALVVIDNMDDGGPYGARTEMKNIIEGTGAVSKKANGGTIVLERKLDPPIDISAYRGVGYAKLHLYIESVDNMSDTPGQLELTSSGRCDVEETSWNISKNMLKDGWNTLYLSFESPGENSADYSKINYVRVYIHITGANTGEVYGEGGAVAAALASMGLETPDAGEGLDESQAGRAAQGKSQGIVWLVAAAVAAALALGIAAIAIYSKKLKKAK